MMVRMFCGTLPRSQRKTTQRKAASCKHRALLGAAGKSLRNEQSRPIWEHDGVQRVDGQETRLGLLKTERNEIRLQSEVAGSYGV